MPVLYLSKDDAVHAREPLGDFRLNELVYGDRTLRYQTRWAFSFLNNIQQPVYEFLKRHDVRAEYWGIYWGTRDSDPSDGNFPSGAEGHLLSRTPFVCLPGDLDFSGMNTSQSLSPCPLLRKIGQVVIYLRFLQKSRIIWRLTI